MWRVWVFFVCVYVCVCAAQSLSCVQLFATLWTTAHQAPLSMGFPRQEYWSGLPFPSSGDLSNPGIKPTSLVSPALVARFFTIVASKTVLKIMNFLFRKNSIKKNNKNQLQSRDNSVYILSHLFSILKICTCMYRIMLCVVYCICICVCVYVLHINGKRWVDFSIKYT